MGDTACMIRRFPVNSSTWTPIVAPCVCSYYMVFAEGEMQLMRASDPANDEAKYTMPPGAGYSVAVTLQGRPSGIRFQAGDTVTWIKTVAGTDVAVAEFIQ
jgi:hypothetical protein